MVVVTNHGPLGDGCQTNLKSTAVVVTGGGGGGAAGCGAGSIFLIREDSRRLRMACPPQKTPCNGCPWMFRTKETRQKHRRHGDL